MGLNVLEDMGVNVDDEKGWGMWKGQDGVNWVTLDREMGAMGTNGIGEEKE